MTNETPNTPGLRETDLREMSVAQLRDEASAAGVDGTSSMKKEDLVRAMSDAQRASGEDGGRPKAGADAGGDEAGLPGDRGPDDGRLRTGEETARSLKYAQNITSLDEDPERQGRSLATTSHEVIRNWAEERDAVPATVEGTEHGDHLGVLRFDFGGDSESLRHVSWDEWFDTFDGRQLNFIYQEERKDGNRSNFFRLESPVREDA